MNDSFENNATSGVAFVLLARYNRTHPFIRLQHQIEWTTLAIHHGMQQSDHRFRALIDLLSAFPTAPIHILRLSGELSRVAGAGRIRLTRRFGRQWLTPKCGVVLYQLDYPHHSKPQLHSHAFIRGWGRNGAHIYSWGRGPARCIHFLSISAHSDFSHANALYIWSCPIV